MYAPFFIAVKAKTRGVGAILLSTDIPMAWMADLIRIRDRELFGAAKNDPKWTLQKSRQNSNESTAVRAADQNRTFSSGAFPTNCGQSFAD